MPDEADFAAVVARVQLHAQTTLEPTLTTAEVEAIVRRTARAATWAATTALAFGAYVIPTAAKLTGRRYRVTKPGTTGATEPTWSEVDGDTLTSGTVTFEEAGLLRGSVYDERKAIEACVMVRYAKDQLVDFSADGQSIKGSQRSDRLLKLARMYQPLEIG